MTFHAPFLPRLATRKRLAMFALAVMLLLTAGAGLEKYLLSTQGALSFLWPASLVMLAVYCLRLILADWAQRIGMETSNDRPTRD